MTGRQVEVNTVDVTMFLILEKKKHNLCSLLITTKPRLYSSGWPGTCCIV